VNLDKWPDGKIDVYHVVDNNIMNSYWEANLPKNFRKPQGNSSNFEVVNFLTDKYVNKKWVDQDMKYTPI